MSAIANRSWIDGGLHASKQSFSRGGRGYRLRSGGVYGGAFPSPDRSARGAPGARPRGGCGSSAGQGYGAQALISRSRHRDKAAGRTLYGLLPSVARIWLRPIQVFHIVQERPRAAVLSRPHAAPDLSRFAGVLPVEPISVDEKRPRRVGKAKRAHYKRRWARFAVPTLQHCAVTARNADQLCRDTPDQAASRSNSCSTASPISAVPTTFAPSDLISWVRKPAARAAAIAWST